VSNKPFPAYCSECAHARPEKNSPWNNECVHPVVNARDPWALATNGDFGPKSSCREERSKRFFARCGMSGKLWEARA
jgi:hypothetical protein